MPLPFIPLILLGGSVIAGIKGAVDTFSAIQQINELQEAYNERRAEYEERRAEYEKAHNRLVVRMNELNDLRLRAYDTIKEAAEFLKRAKVKKRHLAERIARPRLEQPDNWQGAHVDPIEAFQAVLKAGGAGTATAATVYSTVGTLGVASTGTAISTLSGAAATNATLAWLGGGALAAGGGGMALGTAVLGGLVAGPALLTAGFFAQGTVAQIKTKVERQIAEMGAAEEEMQNRIAEYKVIQDRIEELEMTIKQMNATLTDMLATADPNRDQDLFEIARVAKGLAEAIDVKTLPQAA
ncbi:MAG TPA: hypothetical protein DEF43_17745 [Chloroflexus aurantiacus]|jgi:hypothetical protein|uniref:Uncharacterized protein n=1 Tax=Chloroflexus aurantiacus (strain ATCC 29366 / DSM 635 / J-10-fl) TaxID=324602 RepID=A9WJP6_CHLAA|nr:hypothetical protein [Chloroflexus aurantiacus]ABY36512.1 conserved hypothetical protein [Chloroflexus aurantiacus J-10-fl]HBW68953.1 hypothetical protein [Chloroflexus aurantiacus]